ncbi:MAG TPA: FliH/SctL family protein [Vicinamibacterales bacterium]|jgi:flagellar assembly protein FliH|nr:FliH/SctL family protein [Vicinamibacterales bacterium]
MSIKAQRVVKAVEVSQYDWGTDEAPPATLERDGIYRMSGAAAARDTAIRQRADIDPSAIERDAFTKGYAQGERAGVEAAATRGDAMLRRLAQTIDELGTLRAELIHKSERQVVRLAIAIAMRVIHREITLDSELLVAMARVALDRLGDTSSATIRLHPQDHAAALSVRGVTLSTESVSVVADPNVSRGGCLVESDFGLIDLTPAAQVAEIATALLGPELPSAFEETGANVAAL